MSVKNAPPSSGNTAAARAAAPSEIFGGDVKTIFGSLKGGILKIFQGR